MQKLDRTVKPHLKSISFSIEHSNLTTQRQALVTLVTSDFPPVMRFAGLLCSKWGSIHLNQE